MAGKSKAGWSGRNSRSGGWKSSVQETDDYNEYRLSLKEWIVFVGEVLGIAVLAAFVFFDLPLLGIVLSVPAVLILRKPLKRRKAEKRKERFKKQFLNAVTLLGDYLKSGYSVENAIERSTRELEELWGNQSDVVREWRRMAAGQRTARTPENLFRDLGERSGIEEVRTFSELFEIVKRSGGQLSSVVQNTADRLSEAFRVEEQIRTATASKRFEERIMSVMPLGILLYIRFGSPDLLTPLYATLFGRVFMTACLGLYGAAIYVSGRILKIRT